MTITELPPSVLYSSKDMGPGALSRSIGGLKILELQGLSLQRQRTIYERVLHLEGKDGVMFAMLFRASDDIDTIGVYSDGKPRKYAARNGVYVEIGRDGMRAQYDLKNGSMLMQEVDAAAFPNTALPLDMKMEDIELLNELCSQLRNPRTPEPQGIFKISSFLDTAFQTTESAEQPPLFVHQLQMF
jgi:hypothetical protein